VPHCGLNLHFLVTNDDEQLFVLILVIWYLLLWCVSSLPTINLAICFYTSCACLIWMIFFSLSSFLNIFVQNKLYSKYEFWSFFSVSEFFMYFAITVCELILRGRFLPGLFFLFFILFYYYFFSIYTSVRETLSGWLSICWSVFSNKL